MPLSDKSTDNATPGVIVFLRSDVIEFIKELKKELLDYQYQTNPQLNEYCHNNIIKQIDKLAGDALVGVSE